MCLLAVDMPRYRVLQIFYNFYLTLLTARIAGLNEDSHLVRIWLEFNYLVRSK